MSSENVRELRDLDALRAVASPARLEILELLREHRVLTASRCAELLSTTAKSCSYHLHVLARSKLVEQVSTQDRRERPWRLTYDVAETAPLGDEEFREATDEVVRVSAHHTYQAILRFIAARHELPGHWLQATTLTSRVAMFTAEELQEWAEAVEDLTRRHVAKASSSTMPERRRVRLVTYGFPDDRSPATAQGLEPPDGDRP
ncbi:helix-turn-helix domain-containing protein [Nonomuraea bangladeshensis]|uniref:winged helix-turn-helix domain-containing protein n=1 Tax=Nonomuraea bangladeshensis TaxID=404385 RepID=UPI0031D1B828